MFVHSVCKSTFLTDFDALLCTLSTFEFPCFVLEDMNVDLLAQTATSVKYMQVIEKNGFSLEIFVPTRGGTISSTLWNHVLHNSSYEHD